MLRFGRPGPSSPFPAGLPLSSPGEARDRTAGRTAGSPRQQPPDAMRRRSGGETRALRSWRILTPAANSRRAATSPGFRRAACTPVAPVAPDDNFRMTGLDGITRFAHPDAGGQLRRQPPVVRPATASGDSRHADGVVRHDADSSGVFACRASPVACGVNPPEARPSVSSATADRRSAQPSSTAMVARARRP